MTIKLIQKDDTVIEDEITRKVLDQGYVRLVDHMGSDLSVVNAARASYAKESAEFSQNDERLLKFLAKGGHTSPFRHAVITFEFKAPLMVARQHWKYVVGADHTMDGWNESCFPGDQTIVAWPDVDGTRKRYTVQELYELGKENSNDLPYVPSVKSEAIVSNKIKSVWKSGVKDVYEVTSKLGFKIRTTDNHRFLTENGYEELKNISVGDLIYMNDHERSNMAPHLVPIESIELVATEEVYDIEMTDEPNLVVEQFVVHNSRRYITSDPEFYVPDEFEWRSAPENNKQGSGEPLDKAVGLDLTAELKRLIEYGEDRYQWALEKGVAAEQARLFLPAYGMYLYYRWTCSLQSVLHFLYQRLEETAQNEITQYALVTYDLLKDKFPVSVDGWVGDLVD